MGLIQHHAILATTWSPPRVKALQEWAQESGVPITVLSMRTNGYQTIILDPDGSKEEWKGSRAGDRCRALLLKRLGEDSYKDASSPWDIIEVTYGELGASIVFTNTK